MMTIWQTLGIEETGDQRGIKRAYARQLKTTRPEDDPAAFQALNEAYEAALRYSRYVAAAEEAQSDEAQAEGAPAEEAAPALALAEAGAAAGQAGHAPAATHAAPPPAGPDPRLLAARQAAHHARQAAEDRQHEMERAWNDAMGQWRSFLEWSAGDPAGALASQMQSETLHNLLTREAFEVIAVRHCASASCPEALRAAVVQHFGWDQHGSQIAQLDADAAAEALGRYRADISYAHLREAASKNRAVRFLLSDTVPGFCPHTLHAGFMQSMRELLAVIQWRTPEVAHYRLDRDVLAWWQAKAAAKRYYAQTALWSTLAGLVLGVGLLVALTGVRGDAALALLAGSVALTVGGTAWYKLKTDARLGAAIAGYRERHFDRHLHDRKLYLPLRYGWLPAFLGASLLMFIPEPGPLLQGAVTLAMVLCAGAAVLAFAAVLSAWSYVIIAVIGALIGFGIGVAFPAHGWVACLAAGICLESLAVTAAPRLADLQALLGASRLGQLLMAWLAGAALLFYLCIQPALPAMAIAVLAWAWLVTGVVLTTFQVPAGMFFLLFFGSKALYGAMIASMKWPAPQLAVFMPLMLLLAVFILFSLYRAHNNNGNYSS